MNRNLLTDNVLNFFQIELDNYREAVQSGDLDPSGGHVPTLCTAVDSLMQAPEDVALSWLGIEPDDEDAGFLLAHEYLNIARLACDLGGDQLLIEFVE